MDSYLIWKIYGSQEWEYRTLQDSCEKSKNLRSEQMISLRMSNTLRKCWPFLRTGLELSGTTLPIIEPKDKANMKKSIAINEESVFQ
ncbi:uncharacterized protein LOC100688626 [Canis lupus familiaris]|uniref:uncharacterized protein LOC100688626 n=1 Tax=Canis lupus familiaris TaxID=9615 RepID=UPI0018F72953|nr:uncharacterized protein LOC100688626 [Canis lupus familiaris]XP_038317260.1 uncharacterized protein LOC100688626 [Canis lupus familiaris]XP_038317261.1 uncharacterized protein LOC100688626 [Canis lupus familiaris]